MLDEPEPDAPDFDFPDPDPDESDFSDFSDFDEPEPESEVLFAPFDELSEPPASLFATVLPAPARLSVR